MIYHLNFHRILEKNFIHFSAGFDKQQRTLGEKIKKLNKILFIHKNQKMKSSDSQKKSQLESEIKQKVAFIHKNGKINERISEKIFA